MSQHQSGGLESAAIRRAWVRGGPVAWSPVNGAPGGAATRELGNPPAGLGEPPPAADISRDRRAWGLAASGLAAIPPNSHADLQWAMAGITSGDFLAAGQTHTQEQNKTFKNENKTRWRGAAYCLGLVFCQGAHTREGGTGTCRQGRKLKVIVFKGAVCRIELGIAVQIQNIGDGFFHQPFLLRFDARAGCQINETNRNEPHMTMN